MGSKEGFESICEARAQADHVIMVSHWSTSSYLISLTSWASSQLAQALLRFNLELKALETSLTWKKSHQKHVPSLGPRVFYQIRIWNKLKLDDPPTDQVRFDLRLLNPNKKPRLKQMACGGKDFTTQTLKSCMSSLFFFPHGAHQCSKAHIPDPNQTIRGSLCELADTRLDRKIFVGDIKKIIARLKSNIICRKNLCEPSKYRAIHGLLEQSPWEGFFAFHRWNGEQWNCPSALGIGLQFASTDANLKEVQMRSTSGRPQSLVPKRWIRG